MAGLAELEDGGATLADRLDARPPPPGALMRFNVRDELSRTLLPWMLEIEVSLLGREKVREC